MMLRAAAAYIERLGLELVVADAEKRPLERFFPRGASSATQDLRHIRRALEWDPDATLAARVGRHLVLDVDVRHGGPEALARLLAFHGPLPRTWTQQTPSGGWHIWLRDVPFREARGKLVDGVEVLRGNRLVTLSPSRRAGGSYEWVEHPLRVPLAEAPRWIVDAITIPPAPARPTRTVDYDPEERLARARAYLARMDPAVSGQHGHARTFLAAQVATRGFELGEDAALSLLMEWNRNCDPPWSERELRRKVREAIRRGRMEWGAMLDRERTAA